jgi:hypothetical protein
VPDKRPIPTKWAYDLGGQMTTLLTTQQQKTLAKRRKASVLAGRAYLIKRLLKYASHRLRWFEELTTGDNPRYQTIHARITELFLAGIALSYFGDLDLNDVHRTFIGGRSAGSPQQEIARKVTPGHVKSRQFRATVTEARAQVALAFAALHEGYDEGTHFSLAPLYEPLTKLLFDVRGIAREANYPPSTLDARLAEIERQIWLH